MKMDYIFEEELTKHTLKWTPLARWLPQLKTMSNLSLESQANLAVFFLLYFHCLEVWLWYPIWKGKKLFAEEVMSLVKYNVRECWWFNV